MLIDDIENIKSSRKDLRNFSMFLAVALSVIGGLLLAKDKDYYWCFFVLSFLFLFSGLAFPIILKPIHKIWMTVSIVIGWFMSRLILIILFYFVLTPISLIIRLFKKEIMDIRYKKDNRETYWIPRQHDNAAKRDYQKQF